MVDRDDDVVLNAVLYICRLSLDAQSGEKGLYYIAKNKRFVLYYNIFHCLLHNIILAKRHSSVTCEN